MRSEKPPKAPALLRRMERFVATHHLFERGDRLLVGVSGGADSVCLLHLLALLADAWRLELHVAHLNHGLRGAAAVADARYVAELAQQLGLPYTIEERDVASHRAKLRLSLEEAAREVRYAFFAEVAHRLGAPSVVVGHTADDQVETVLLHLLRGTGTAGLRGMAPTMQWDSKTATYPLKVVRPLLEVRRAQTQAYCAAHDLKPRSDVSNLDLSFTRNRIRAELLLSLRQYNPNIDAALLRLARTAADEMAFWEEQAVALCDRAVRHEGKGIFLELSSLAGQPPALVRHVLREGMRRLSGDLLRVEEAHVEAMKECMTRPGSRLSLPGGLHYYVDYGRVWLGPEPYPPVPLPLLDGEHSLTVPGMTEIPGWRISAKVIPANTANSCPKGWQARLDFDVAGDRLRVRPRRPGDRFQPLGMSGPKKLQDFMVEEKIPRPWRDRIPILTDGSRILWVVGWRIDHRARVTDATRRILVLEFQRNP